MEESVLLFSMDLTPHNSDMLDSIWTPGKNKQSCCCGITACHPFPLLVTASSLTCLVGDSELNLYFAALKSLCLFGKVAICFLRIRGYLFLDVHCPSLSIFSGCPRLVSARKHALNVFKGIVVSRCFDMSLEFHTVFVV